MEWKYTIQPFAIPDTDEGLIEAEEDLADLASGGWEIFQVVRRAGKQFENKNEFFVFARRPVEK